MVRGPAFRERAALASVAPCFNKSRRASPRRTAGIKHKKPGASVKKPGTISKIALIHAIPPSSKAAVDNSPHVTAKPNCSNSAAPCIRNITTPSIVVATASNTMGKNPIQEATLTNK